MFRAELFSSVGKGDFVFIPILAVNRAKDIWGEDSFEFRCIIMFLVMP